MKKKNPKRMLNFRYRDLTYGQLKAFLAMQMQLAEIWEFLITISPYSAKMTIYLPAYYSKHQIKQVENIIYQYAPVSILCNIRVTNNLALFEK